MGRDRGELLYSLLLLFFYRDGFLLQIFGVVVGLDVIHAIYLTVVGFVASGALGACQRLRTVVATGTRASACTMRGLLHVPLVYERVGFRMMAGVAIRKYYALHLHKVSASEERVSRFTSSSATKVQMSSRTTSIASLHCFVVKFGTYIGS